jgi:predicted  nucleic acid-binding Zn-ribbon protein
VPTQSILEQIRKLVELQKADESFFQIKTKLKEKPQTIEALRLAFEKKKTNYHAIQDKLKAVQLHRKQQELDLKAIEDSIAKANTQLSLIKTNKEYTAKIGEIEGLKADKSVLEEKILNEFDESDGITKELEKEKTVVDEEEKKFLSQKQVIEKEIEELSQQVAGLESQRKQLLDGIDPNLLRRYEMILEHKGGIAIVPIVAGNSCGGCYMNVPQQTINQLKMHDKLVECEICNRILYLEDDL